MEKIEELEQRVEQLERELAESETRRQQLLDESEKTLDIAKHAYKVDHYGFIWVYEWQTKEYVKTDMRVLTPEIAERAIKAKHLADKCIEGRHMVDDLIEGRMIQDDTIDGRSIKPDAIDSEKIVDNSVYGDRFEHDALIPGKIADDAVQERNIKDRNVTEPKLADQSVSTRTLMDKAVTPEKVSDNFGGKVVLPLVNPVDQKYANITDELYSMVRSLQVGGVALSNQFGGREDIGITQKALTRMFGALWDTIESLHPGHAVFDFTLTVNPQYIFNEVVEDHVSVKADCTGAVSDFDSVKVYVDDELKAESKGIKVYETSIIVTKTSTIKVVGTILGKEIVKTAQVINEIPFFMGGGMEYTDIMNEECRKELVGSLEGEYDATISTTGQYLFVIIPISRREEFRRCKMDMNGFEIPIETTEMTDYIVCKSLNQYQTGTYNIDIDINS